MINKQKLYFIALMSAAMISMLVSIAGAAPFAYITNYGNNNVSVIDTVTNTVIATVNVGTGPGGVAVTLDETKVYVVNVWDSTVSVIDTGTNTVTATVNVGTFPVGVAVSPNGTEAYVANYGDNNVSVIDTGTNTVIAKVNVGKGPGGVAVTPDGTKVYVANSGMNPGGWAAFPGNVSVIDTATNTVITNV